MISASSASLAALAATDTALNNAEQILAQDKAQLDSLLGLQPGVDIQATPPDAAPIDPAAADQAIATLASRRPDLIALRYGYQKADAGLRAAIMSQFLPVSVGVADGSDTSKIVSAGPQISLNLPLFNRNRGAIAAASATRTQLAAQFAANLASAAGEAKALQASIVLLQSQNQAAEVNANAAAQSAREAQTEFATGNLDALAAVDIEIAAADRQREAIALKTQLLTARLSLATLLGIGLPPLAAPEMVAAR
jgi:outer membrane protein TolC